MDFFLAIKLKVFAFLIFLRLKVRQYWGNFLHKNILSIREDVITFRHLNDGKDFKARIETVNFHFMFPLTQENCLFQNILSSETIFLNLHQIGHCMA